MGTKTAYLGPTSGYFGHGTRPDFMGPLQIDTSGRLHYPSSGIVYSFSGGAKFKLDYDEYPTTVSVVEYGHPDSGKSGYWQNETGSEYTTSDNCKVYLCLLQNNTHAEDRLVHEFNVKNNHGTLTPTVSSVAISNNAVFTGKELYIHAHSSYCTLVGWCKFQFNTDYVPYSITYSNGENGKATGAVSAKRGSKVEITIKPNDGYELDSISSSAGSLAKKSTNLYELTTPSPGGNVEVVTTYKKSTYSVTANPNIKGAGTVSVSGTYQIGNTITIQQNPTNREYRFDEWSIVANGNTVSYTRVNDNIATFTMPPSKVNVTALYTQHEISWSYASLTASQDNTEITLTYRGEATDNFNRNLTFYIYRDGSKDIEVSTPGSLDKSVIVHVSGSDVGNAMRFTLVAEDEFGNSAGGATASLNIGSINRTIKYCVNGKKSTWVECVPYFCVGSKYEKRADVDPDNLLLHYVRISYQGVYDVPFTRAGEGSYIYINNTDDLVLIEIYGTNNTLLGYVELEPLEEKTVQSFAGGKNAIFHIDGEGSVEMQYETWPSAYDSAEEEKKVITGIWVEVEPYYYRTTDGWQLCSFE